MLQSLLSAIRQEDLKIGVIRDVPAFPGARLASAGFPLTVIRTIRRYSYTRRVLISNSVSKTSRPRNNLTRERRQDPQVEQLLLAARTACDME
jgi:hypothetical protein